MRREGTALRGLGVVTLKELSDHMTSARMRVLEWLVVLVALAAVYAAIVQIRSATAEDPFLFLRLFTHGTRAVAVVHGVPRLSGAVDGDRSRLRRGQWRAQPPHFVAHSVAADLSRRLAVRQIHRRACDIVGQPDRAVAAHDRARSHHARRTAGRRRDGARLHFSPDNDCLCRRMARALHAVFGDVPVGRDGGAGDARLLAVLLADLAGALAGDRPDVRAGRRRGVFGDCGADAGAIVAFERSTPKR